MNGGHCYYLPWHTFNMNGFALKGSSSAIFFVSQWLSFLMKVTPSRENSFLERYTALAD